MGRHRPPGIAGLALAALALAGCGEDPGVEEGLVPFKGTNTSSLAPLREEMSKNMKNRAYLKKGGEGGESSASPAGAAGSRPAGESGPAPPPPTGPATKGG